MKGDFKGVLQPREAMVGPLAGTVAQVESTQVLQGIKASTSDSYRWEDNTDPVILARVWDGTTTVFEVRVNGQVNALQLGFVGYADDPESTPIIFLAGDGSTSASLAINGPIVAGGGAGAPAIELYSNATDGRISLGADTYVFLQTPVVYITSTDTNLYRSAANVLKTDDQFIAADGLAGKYVSAAGRVNGADTDFTVTPPNGTMYVVRNSTDSKGYLTGRVNGAWKAVEIV